MRLSSFLFLFLTLYSNCIFVQTSTDYRIKVIHENYSVVRENLASYTTETVEVWDESSEGGEAIGYFHQARVQMIEVVLFGETRKYSSEYYFKNDSLYFVFTQDFIYNRPFYWDEKYAIESGDNEAYDPEKTITKENRYYFHNDRLFKWLDPEKRQIDLTSEENSKKGLDIIRRSLKIKDKFKNRDIHQ